MRQGQDPHHVSDAQVPMRALGSSPYTPGDSPTLVRGTGSRARDLTKGFHWTVWWTMALDPYPKADSPQCLRIKGQEFYRQREGAPCRNSAVSSDGPLAIGHRWSEQQHLDCLGPIFRSKVGLFPFLGGQFSELWQLMSWVQSGHPVVNFSTCCFGPCKTAHRIWLRILSTALEKELKVLDYA